MDNKRELSVLQFIAALIITFAVSWPEVRQSLSQTFAFADIAIPAFAFVLLFQVLFFIYTRYLWKLSTHPMYLGGQWIYRTTNAKREENDPSLSKDRTQSQYGTFNIMHTPFTLSISQGEAWSCGKTPNSEKSAIWNSEAVVLQNKKLWIVANVTGNDPDNSRQVQLADLTITQKGQLIEIDGTIWGVADPDGKYAYGTTEMRRIGEDLKSSPAEEAYRIFGI
jgi:hypothetical protein